MNLTVSLLDPRYVLLLCCLPLLRLVWPSRYYLGLLLASTVVIIGVGSPRTLALITVLTVCFIFPLLLLHRWSRDRRWPAAVSGSILPVGIGTLVLLLLVSKLYAEFTMPWLANPWLRAEIVSLVGLSYFVFRAISILRVSTILKLHERTPWVMLSYTLFPATITSGPIQKYQDFYEQVRRPAQLTKDLFYEAAYRITRGFFRKVFLGMVLNGAIQLLVDRPEFTLWTSTLVVALFYVYLYVDFAGYSDIAIGVGLLLGIRVPENFKKPFLATTFSEFWRNWHITLADFLREHIYIPLGGMRAAPVKAAVLVFVVMILCGLWHGLTVAFVLWGAFHGTWLAVEALRGTGPVPPNQRHGPRYWGRVLWLNARVALACLPLLPGPGNVLRVLQGFVNLGFRS
jgi:alginate O-acetyltransferase complex protein AlgI